MDNDNAKIVRMIHKDPRDPQDVVLKMAPHVAEAAAAEARQIVQERGLDVDVWTSPEGLHLNGPKIHLITLFLLEN